MSVWNRTATSPTITMAVHVLMLNTHAFLIVQYFDQGLNPACSLIFLSFSESFFLQFFESPGRGPET